jgi:hypothetical protein
MRESFPRPRNVARERAPGLRYEGHPRVSSGGDEGTRTPDPRDANAVLSQLSYIPTGRPGGEACRGPVPESSTHPWRGRGRGPEFEWK